MGAISSVFLFFFVGFKLKNTFNNTLFIELGLVIG